LADVKTPQENLNATAKHEGTKEKMFVFFLSSSLRVCILLGNPDSVAQDFSPAHAGAEPRRIQ